MNGLMGSETTNPESLSELERLRARVAELEQVNKTKQLYEEQLYFQAGMLAQVDDAIVAVDNDRRIIFWNTGAERLYGMIGSQVIGQPLEYAYEVKWPNPGDEAASAEIINRTGSWRGDVVQVRNNGSEIYVDAGVSILRDSEGQRIGLLAVIRDITTRKASEEALQFLAEASALIGASLNYELTLQNLARLVIPTLADWCVFFLNEQNGEFRRIAVNHLDVDKEASLNELLGGLSDYLSQRDFVQQVLDTGRPILYNDVAQFKWAESWTDQRQIELWRQIEPAAVLTVPLITQGQTLGIMICGTTRKDYYQSRHITLAQELARRAALAVENARLYEQTQEALKAQQALDSLKDQFLSIASHELRTPLAAIKGYVQMLQRQRLRNEVSLDPAREVRMLNNMNQQLLRMNDLIGEMLDVSRIQNGKLQLHYDADVNLVEIIERLVEQQQEQAAITAHRLLVETNSPDIRATIDEARVEQVLNNLISNALKYSLPNKPVTVGINLPQADTVTLWVCDEGIGIETQEQEHIFERFYRIGQRGDINIDGLGLGLFISREIVVRHGGHIWVESTLGVGSTFYFSLPLKPPRQDLVNGGLQD